MHIALHRPARTPRQRLYSYEAFEDIALILAIRHQREAGVADLPTVK